MTQGVLQNQVITDTVVAQESLLTGVAIGTFQEDFRLCEADFLRLKSDDSKLTIWSQNILFASIGYGMSILPKWIAEISGKAEKVSQIEWAVLAIGVSFSLALSVINRFIPNEKNRATQQNGSTLQISTEDAPIH